MPDNKYEITDTIFAISSPTSEKRVIIRISGFDTFKICRSLFDIEPALITKRHIIATEIHIDQELQIPAQIYLFSCPNSYTGEDVAEIHINTNSSVTEALLDKLLQYGLRVAEPGEFTARAYLNGRMDLAQAEAVNEIIVCSNEFQLVAAQNLLKGRLSQTTTKICTSILDCLSRIEAGLDFSGEDIEFISRHEAFDMLTGIKQQLEELLTGSIRYESLVDLPSVGIAGAPNAGKSTLINKLLGSERSIVSNQRKTTRDVLTGQMKLRHCNCILFDCAGLIPEPENILDELALQSAIEALRNSSVVIFCIDISKGQFSEDIAVRKLINPKFLIPVATKCDLVEQKDLPVLLEQLKKMFLEQFLPISAHQGQGLDILHEKLDSFLYSQPSDSQSHLALTSRHKKVVTDAITNLTEAIEELNSNNDEVCAMILRSAYREISQIEQHQIDEQILELIFSRFCIGK